MIVVVSAQDISESEKTPVPELVESTTVSLKDVSVSPDASVAAMIIAGDAVPSGAVNAGVLILRRVAVKLIVGSLCRRVESYQAVPVPYKEVITLQYTVA